MTRQVVEGAPITVTVRSKATGGVVTDVPLAVTGGPVNGADGKKVKDTVTDGSGSFTFYGAPGTYTFTVPEGHLDVEPVHVVATTSRPGGLAAVDADGDVTERVSDASLVGAPPDGDLAQAGALSAQVIPPGDPADGTPDGTTASDPAAAPAAPDEVAAEPVNPDPVDPEVQQ